MCTQHKESFKTWKCFWFDVCSETALNLRSRRFWQHLVIRFQLCASCLLMANSLDSLPLQAVPITSYASTEWPRPTHCISYKDILTQVQLVDFVTPLLCVSLVWFFLGNHLWSISVWYIFWCMSFQHFIFLNLFVLFSRI